MATAGATVATGGRGKGDGWARQGRRCWRDDGDSGPGDGDGRRDDAGATMATAGPAMATADATMLARQ
jgi:hypothetical protein